MTNSGKFGALRVGINTLTSEYISKYTHEWNEYMRLKETSPAEAAVHMAKHKLLKKVVRDLEGVVRSECQ